MKTKEEILFELPNFYGTETYTRWSMLFPNFVLTDGAKYIAESCDAYWLMDAIASHVRSYRKEEFGSVTFSREEKNWLLKITDGNETTLATQAKMSQLLHAEEAKR